MTDLLDRAAAEEPRGDPGPDPTADPAPPSSAAPEPGAPADPVPAAHRALLAAVLLGAGGIHLAMAPSHLDGSVWEGAGFLAAGWAQATLALLVVAAGRGGARRWRVRWRWLLPAVAGVNLALVVAWAVSRTTGLPVGAHAGEAEPVGLVDGVCAGLEVAAAGVAATLVVARRRVTGPLPRRGALVAAGLAVVLATAALASPDARDHAAGHDDGGTGHAAGHDDATAAMAGDHGHAAGSDAAADEASGFAELVNGHHHDTGVEPLTVEESVTLARQLASTVDLMEKYPTLGDAEAAGYRRNGPFTPGLGTHYAPPNAPLNTDGDMDPEDLANAFLIYDGLEPDAPIAGFMFLAAEVEPEGFAGPNDHWHYHDNVCVIIHPDGTLDSPLASDTSGTTKERCDEIGGQWIPFTGYMVHVWNVPGYESPDGMFTEVNRAITCPDGTYHRIPLTDIVGKDNLCVNP
ncbi:MAG TPA: hypothetical protein VIL36_17205 [Acidimicrobiales bacterium]